MIVISVMSWKWRQHLVAFGVVTRLLGASDWLQYRHLVVGWTARRQLYLSGFLCEVQGAIQRITTLLLSVSWVISKHLLDLLDIFGDMMPSAFMSYVCMSMHGFGMQFLEQQRHCFPSWRRRKYA